MGYTLESGADRRTLKDWGIAENSVDLVLRSFEADTLSFSAASNDTLGEFLFDYGDFITLKKDGVAVFVGSVRDMPVYGGAGGERQRYTAYNFWHGLECWIYQQGRKIIDPTFSSLGLVSTSQVIFGRNPANGAKRTNQQEIAALCAYAGLGVGQAYTGVVPPFEEATDITVANGIRRMAAWQPDLVGRAVYGGGTPYLSITNRAGASSRALDLTGADSIISVQGKMRRDIKPDGIIIKFITREQNPATGAYYFRVTEQTAGAPNTGPYTMICTLNIGDGEAIPPALAAAYYYGLATCYIEGSITLAGREPDLGWTPGMLIDFENAPADWSAGVAPITEVSYDLGAGTTTLTFGPPQFLPLSSFALLNAKVKDTRNDPTKPPVGPGDGTEGDNGGSHDTGKAGGGSGGGGGGGGVSITHCVGGVQQSTQVAKV